MTNASRKGIAFEQWVTKLYDELGKLNVRHDVTKTMKGNVKAQFDVTYGLVRTHYIECKYHENGSVVPFKDVAIFAGKLELIKANYRQGSMVTNTGYEKRAIAYARKTGITLIDRKKLEQLDRRRQGIISTLLGRKRNIEAYVNKLAQQYH